MRCLGLDIAVSFVAHPVESKMSGSSRLKMMDEFRGFIKVDSHEAVNIGDLVEKNRWRSLLSSPSLAKIVEKRRSAKEWKNWRFEEMRNVDCAPSSTPRMWETMDWRPPLVDEDWHAICPAIYKGIAGEAWKKLFYKCVAKKQDGHHSSAESQSQGKDPVESKMSKNEWRRRPGYLCDKNWKSCSSEVRYVGQALAESGDGAGRRKDGFGRGPDGVWHCGRTQGAKRARLLSALGRSVFF